MSFQSTHPVRGATCLVTPSSSAICYFNPRTPCGVRPCHTLPAMPSQTISIHAPRAGCDLFISNFAIFYVHFNPRTPCGVRQVTSYRDDATMQFQSTHPVRGATKQVGAFLGTGKFQSTHPVRGATFQAWTTFCRFSFQSTHPVRGATVSLCALFKHQHISIHAPRAGCDGKEHTRQVAGIDFNPRTPCGVRHDLTGYVAKPSFISIHAPRAGCDP